MQRNFFQDLPVDRTHTVTIKRYESSGMTPVGNGFLLSLSLCMDIGVVNIAMITQAPQCG